MVSGYQHAHYARALAEFGHPLYLPASGGWVLQREIPQAGQYDAASCYPLFACREWNGLADDLDDLARQKSLVSLAAITDPLGAYSESELQRAFRDVVMPFKAHFIADLSRPLDAFVCAHHRRNARQALRHLAIEQCNPAEVVDEWHALYAHLIERHHIEGVATFSRASFAAQLQVPGITVFRARHANETVGMTLWFRREDRAYYHLAAYAPLGYALKASFALFWQAYEHFAKLGVQWVALGACAGLAEQQGDGLTRFKQGWATGTRTAYLCGRIFDKVSYEQLARNANANDQAFFPAYRRPRAVNAQVAGQG